MESGNNLSIMVIGAHPDDCDLRAGGLALKYRALGHTVRFVSMTNGDKGHHRQSGGDLARRRYQEAQAAAAVADIHYDILDIPDGELDPTLATRQVVIRLMREHKPDLVLCPRPYDYHPDHRAVGVLVQDAAYTVTAPNIVPLTPHLPRPPVVGYVWDHFTKPIPFEATVAVDIGDVLERKIDMIHCHTSQFYEWLPANRGESGEVPEDPSQRRRYLAARLGKRFGQVAMTCRETLKRWYGPARGDRIAHAEAVEISEYGAPLTEQEVPRLFPFFTS